MSTTFRIFLAAAMLAAILPMSAHAHRSWLLPTSTLVDSKDPWVTVDAAVSEDLFYPDTVGLKLDGLAIIGPDGVSVAPENIFGGKLRNSFDIKLPHPGTYKIGVVTESVMASYQLNGETKRWRGTEQTFKSEIPKDAQDLKATHMLARFETFVSAGKTDTGALKISGKGLELLPVTHPNDLRTGDKVTLKLMLDGKPAANLPFSLVPGGVRYRGTLGEIRLSTDAKGEATFILREAGVYWLSATYPLRVMPQPGQMPMEDMPERRVSYAATLEVLPQ